MNREIFSLRLPPKLISELNAMCEEIGHNVKRTSLIEWACEWYAAAYEANGRRPLTQRDMQGLMDYLRGKAVGEHPHNPPLALAAEDAAHYKSAGGAHKTTDPSSSTSSSQKKKPQNKKSYRSG